MELSEREAHCVARLLQGAIYGDSYLTGCGYCKYNRADENGFIYGSCADKIRARLTEETGVELNNEVFTPDFEREWPYLRFLRNSNDRVKRVVLARADDYAASLKAAAAE